MRGASLFAIALATIRRSPGSRVHLIVRAFATIADIGSWHTFKPIFWLRSDKMPLAPTVSLPISCNISISSRTVAEMRRSAASICCFARPEIWSSSPAARRKTTFVSKYEIKGQSTSGPIAVECPARDAFELDLSVSVCPSKWASLLIGRASMAVVPVRGGLFGPYGRVQSIRRSENALLAEINSCEIP